MWGKIGNKRWQTKLIGISMSISSTRLVSYSSRLWRLLILTWQTRPNRLSGIKCKVTNLVFKSILSCRVISLWTRYYLNFKIKVCRKYPLWKKIIKTRIFSKIRKELKCSKGGFCHGIYDFMYIMHEIVQVALDKKMKTEKVYRQMKRLTDGRTKTTIDQKSSLILSAQVSEKWKTMSTH